MSDKKDYTLIPKAEEKNTDNNQEHSDNKRSENGIKDEDMIPEEKDKKPKPVSSFTQLFRFADKFDVFLMVLGTLGAMGEGAALPIQFVIFGGLSDAFIDYARCPPPFANCTKLDIEDELTQFSYYYIALALGLALAILFQNAAWGVTAERQVHKIRKAYFKSILRQDMAWFDAFDSGELNTRLSDDMNKIADGMGYKFAMLIKSFAGLIAAYTLGFSFGWKLTLVMLSVFPLVVLTGYFVSSVVTGLSAKEVKSYAAAGSIAQEVLSSMRTVAAFGGERREAERYSERLTVARQLGEKKGFATGFSIGLYILLIYCSYALAFWYGGKLVIEKEMSGGDIVVVFFSVMTGSALFGQSGPSLQAITAARGAAYEIFALIDTVPAIDIYSKEGEIPQQLQGDVEFEDVFFSYPTRPNVQVLTSFCLRIKNGKMVALVGESGCGKSTLIKLIQRFYDTTNGRVKIDGNDIKCLNLKWLRQHIGVVSQEPVLFGTTIAENIRFGKDGATQEEIEKVAQMANAHSFIQYLPKGYETLCGERGTQLSGGQKQRIAIARALLRNPRILLLDEATSALDTESESLVKDALDKAGKGRTTVVIAHRLSTVRNADMIITIQNGNVVETGTHEELIEKNGLYKELVTLQIYEENKEANNMLPTENTENDIAVASSNKICDAVISDGSAVSPDNIDDGAVPLVEVKESDVTVEDSVKPASFMTILKYARKEWRYYFIGTFGACINGAYPFMFAFLLGEILSTFEYNPTIKSERQKMQEETEFWALMFLAMASANFIGNLLQNWMYAVAGEILTERLRKRAFECMLSQSMSYFDDPGHSTGALTANLATRASEVKGAVGSRVGIVCSSLITAIGCLLLAFFSGWKLALVILAFIPFLAIAGSLRSKFFLEGKVGKSVDAEEAGKVAVEVISNIQTVASLTREETFYNKYTKIGSSIYKQRRHQSVISGLLMSCSTPVFLLSNAAAFRFAGYLVKSGEMNFADVMKTILAVQMGALFFGQLTAFTPDFLKAKVAASSLFKLFDTIPSIRSDTKEGLRPDTIEGNVKFENVSFAYPFRSDVQVLDCLDLEINAGQTVALVGASGCGKSTVVSLIERLYDIHSGSIMIDGKDLKSFNVSWLRRQIGIVSQEPVLFNCSLHDNIAYGDVRREISQEEIERATKAANIHDFISSLPKGYDTLAGDKGTLISGGQKQRIAIARALIRNPKILLLDEATSALDTESEKVVQEALDRASVGRTTLIIAHRLSTIQNADVIVVIKSGQVVEQGTHQKLMDMKGSYYSLQQSVNANQ